MFDDEGTIQESEIFMEGDEITIISGPLTSLREDTKKTGGKEEHVCSWIFLSEERVIDLGVNIIEAIK